VLVQVLLLCILQDQLVPAQMTSAARMRRAVMHHLAPVQMSCQLLLLPAGVLCMWLSETLVLGCHSAVLDTPVAPANAGLSRPRQ
jgi:hypothetical protein